MAAGETARFEGPQDAIGLANAEKAQRILAAWYRELHKVTLESTDQVIEQRGNRGVGCFFSGGVDSF